MTPSIEELEAKLNLSGLNWADFEKNQWGEQIYDGVAYVMRVGMHMGRPTQAIVAHGRFVRLRAAPEFEDMFLEPLNPADPSTTLYTTTSPMEDNKGVTVSEHWKPRAFGLQGLRGLLEKAGSYLSGILRS